MPILSMGKAEKEAMVRGLRKNLKRKQWGWESWTSASMSELVNMVNLGHDLSESS